MAVLGVEYEKNTFGVGAGGLMVGGHGQRMGASESVVGGLAEERRAIYNHPMSHYIAKETSPTNQSFKGRHSSPAGSTQALGPTVYSSLQQPQAGD